MKRPKVKKIISVIALFLVVGLGLYFILKIQRQAIEVKKSSSLSLSSASALEALDSGSGDRSPISGLACYNAGRRPLAVMLSGDAVARPLSGISEADIVIDMPVFAQSVTRYLAIFVCADSKEIGSVRSARQDFIYLAAGFDAIFAHWGGERSALEGLNAKIIDNIDGLTNLFNAYFRKSGVAQPHNGFSSANRLLDAANKLGYRLEGGFSGYRHLPSGSSYSKGSKTLSIIYLEGSDVEYEYDPITNFYLRWRGGKKEVDKNNNQQVAAKNVVIMRAATSQIDEQYNTVKIEGEGVAVFYINGEEISGKWAKDPKSILSKLYFLDNSGKEIEFMPGQIWIQIIDPAQKADWHS